MNSIHPTFLCAGYRYAKKLYSGGPGLNFHTDTDEAMTAPKRRFTNEELLAQNKRLASEVGGLRDALDDLYSANGGVPFNGAWVRRLQREAQGWRRLYEARKAWDKQKASASIRADARAKFEAELIALAATHVPEPEASAEEFQEWASETFPRIKP